jgi:uncharacterized protein (TIGR03067 family)
MRMCALTALFYFLLAFPAAVPAQEDKNDSDRIQGVWEVVTLHQGGEDLGDLVRKLSPRFIFNGNKYVHKAGMFSENGGFKLDHKSKVPAVDLTITEGKDKGKYQLGIYHLEGDNLKICLAQVGAKDRPAFFASKADAAEYILITLKRQKKE